MDRAVTRSVGIVPSSPPEEGFGGDIADFARQLWWERRLRTKFFPAELFLEPAWDLILDVFAAEQAGEPVRLSKTHLSACAPPSAAERKARLLVKIGMLTATPISPGGRSLELKLTPSAASKLERLLHEILFHRVNRHSDLASGANAREGRLRQLAATLSACRDELDQLAAWRGAAHLSQAIDAIDQDLTKPSPGCR